MADEMSKHKAYLTVLRLFALVVDLPACLGEGLNDLERLGQARAEVSKPEAGAGYCERGRQDREWVIGRGV